MAKTHYLLLWLFLVLIVCLIIGIIYIFQYKSTEKFTDGDTDEVSKGKKAQIEGIFETIFQRKPKEAELAHYMADEYTDNTAISLAIIRDAEAIRKGDLTNNESKQIPVDAFSRRFVETTVTRLRGSVDSLQSELNKVSSELDAVSQFI
jgi:hypothetical protein